MALLEVSDLAPFATIEATKAGQMIVDAIAQATLAAPCLADEYELSQLQLAQAKSILRGAVLRWNDAGSGAVSQQAAGPFSQVITPVTRKSLFWPSEITDLQKICATATSGGAFNIDTAADPMEFHSSLCEFGGGCSCGAGGGFSPADYAGGA